MLPRRLIKVVVYIVVGTLVFTTLFMGIGSLVSM